MNTYSIADLEVMNEKQLESLILGNHASQNDARYVLGKHMLEGTSDLIPKNENKGLNWIKEAVKRNHMPSLEFKTYWDIRFDRQPKLQQIKENLQTIIDTNKSCRACNVLAELNHASAGSQLAQNPEYAAVAAQNRDNAAKFYLISAEQGDVIGTHWMGVFYHEGWGVAKNIEKAVEFLTRSANAGNGQSWFQLYLIHSGKEGQDQALKDPIKAYHYLLNAVYRGVTYFEELLAFFAANYEVLAPVFLKQKNITTENSQKEIQNIFDAFVDEMKVAFSAGLSKDRLYNRPCGFLNDQQIWMVGVNIQFFLDSVLRFDHADFLKAIKFDLGPILGDVGIWCVKSLQDQAREKGDADLKKKLSVVQEIIEKYLENELEVLG